MHSTNTYCGGHCDVVGGALASDEELAEKLGSIRTSTGEVAAAFDAWLVLRGLCTLSVRMERRGDNAE